MLKKLFTTLYKQFEHKGYFAEAFGYPCVDATDGISPGFLDYDINSAIFLKLRKDNLWPIESSISEYSEEDIFDIIELLFDFVSEPTETYFHSYANCGEHYQKFTKERGQKEWRSEVNNLIKDYKSGYELSNIGEILELPTSGFSHLMTAPLITNKDAIEVKLENAKNKFRKFNADTEDKRDAIKDLVDILEFLRPKAKILLHKQDEQDLFNIANNFGIRHFNDQQKLQYDKNIWLNWMFYFYLATIHALDRFIKRSLDK